METTAEEADAVQPPIPIRGVHHVVLTVTRVERSRAFFEELLGFEKVADFGPRAVLVRDDLMIALGPPPDGSRAIPEDRFDPNRVGLDHLSFAVASRDELERAVRRFDERGVEHKGIKDLGPDLGICVLAFRDPDGIALELTAPRAGA